MSDPRFFLVPSGEIAIGNPGDPHEMIRKFREAEAYLEKRNDTLDLDYFRGLKILEGTNTKVRLDAALYDYYKDDDPESIILMTSGGKLNYPYKVIPCTDAVLMGVYILLKDIPRGQVLLEKKAADTHDNARLAVLKMDRRMKRLKRSHAMVRTYSEKNHLNRFKVAFWSITFWRAIFRLWSSLPFYELEYKDTGPELTEAQAQLEKRLLLVLMPLGRFNPLSILNRYRRRAAGKKR